MYMWLISTISLFTNNKYCYSCRLLLLLNWQVPLSPILDVLLYKIIYYFTPSQQLIIILWQHTTHNKYNNVHSIPISKISQISLRQQIGIHVMHIISNQRFLNSSCNKSRRNIAQQPTVPISLTVVSSFNHSSNLFTSTNKYVW